MALTKEKLKDLFAAGDFDDYMPGASVAWEDIIGKPSSMPASDVYAWAKAATKPSYAWSEIGSKPTTFPPATHTHTKANITDFPTSMPASDVYAWAKAATKPSYTHTEVGAAASGHNHNGTYASVGYNNAYAYLGGTYVSGGNEKPNYFGSGKLKLQMLSGGNLGGGVGWNDVLWMSSYTGPDVKPSNALILGKSSDYIGFVRQNYDATAWGTVRTILHSGNYTTYTQKKITTGTTYPTSPVDGDIHIYG